MPSTIQPSTVAIQSLSDAVARVREHTQRVYFTSEIVGFHGMAKTNPIEYVRRLNVGLGDVALVITTGDSVVACHVQDLVCNCEAEEGIQIAVVDPDGVARHADTISINEFQSLISNLQVELSEQDRKKKFFVIAGSSVSEIQVGLIQKHLLQAA